MKRAFTEFYIEDIASFKQQLLNWCDRFNSCCFLDSHQYQLPGGQYELIAGVGVVADIHLPAGQALDALAAFHNSQQDWLFGHLSYDLKNELEPMHSPVEDLIGFPDLYFFVPQYIFIVTATIVRIGTLDDTAAAVWASIGGMPAGPFMAAQCKGQVTARLSREEYISTVEHLQQHILRGDCYEVNFCQEFYSKDLEIDPVHTYALLTAFSPNPFCAYYKRGDSYLLCASPERYLRNDGGHLLSQPIKGTGKRFPAEPDKDAAEKERLAASAKEQSENVMVVDLVRNDLSKVCIPGSVEVSELFGIYAFPQVFQMISSVTGQLAADSTWMDAIRATFPMGSMTGAPKLKVMELIDTYEKGRRGIFSGAVGYIRPDGDFDFNVVIRSILYNAATRYLSFQVGSGITFYADAAQEYEECLLKAGAIKNALDIV